MSEWDDTPETDDTIAFVRRPVNTREIRKSHEYKVARDRYRAKCAVRRQPDGSLGDPCVICLTLGVTGGAERIDYNLVYPHPKSWSLEHTVSVNDHPEWLLDENNFASAHWDCNSMKGTEELVPDTGVASEDW